MQDCCTTSVFLKIFRSLLTPWVFPSPQLLHALVGGADAGVRDQGCCPLKALCTLALGSIPGHGAAPLCSPVEDLNDHHLNYLFGVLHAIFQEAFWKLLMDRFFSSKLVSVVWEAWHYQGEVLWWHWAQLAPSVMHFWWKMRDTTGAHLPHLEQPHDDPCGVGGRHRAF